MDLKLSRWSMDVVLLVFRYAYFTCSRRPEVSDFGCPVSYECKFQNVSYYTRNIFIKGIYKYLNSFASLYTNSCSFIGFWSFYEKLRNSKMYKIHVIQGNIKNIESEAAVTISPKWNQSLYFCYYITQIVMLVKIWNFVKIYYNKFIKVSGCFPGGSV